MDDNFREVESVEYEYDKKTPPSIAIVEAISACENVDPTSATEAVSFTLYDHIDPSALDSIFNHTRSSGGVAVEFEIEGETTYQVEVTQQHIQIQWCRSPNQIL